MTEDTQVVTASPPPPPLESPIEAMPILVKEKKPKPPPKEKDKPWPMRPMTPDEIAVDAIRVACVEAIDKDLASRRLQIKQYQLRRKPVPKNIDRPRAIARASIIVDGHRWNLMMEQVT